MDNLIGTAAHESPIRELSKDSEKYISSFLQYCNNLKPFCCK